MNTAIVHGHMLTKEGNLDSGFKNNLYMAIRLVNAGRLDTIIITGGFTRKGLPSEANRGCEFIRNQTSLPIKLETKSRSSAENVMLTKEQYGNEKFDTVYVIARQSSIRRMKYLYRRLWRKAYDKATFIGTEFEQSRFERFMEWVYYGIALIDPKEKVILRIPKLLFRQ